MRLAPTLHSMLLALACAGNAYAVDQGPIPLTLVWKMSLDAHGSITALQAIPSRADNVPAIRERLEQAIRGWQFQPGSINGQPQPTDTQLTVKVSVAEAGPDTATIRIESAKTGARLEHVTPPHYPVAAVHDHRSGLVVLRVKYDANGTVVSAEPDADAPRPHVELAQAAQAAARQWTFDTERVGGIGVGGAALVPFCFSLTRYSGGKPPAVPQCHWTPKGQTTPLGDGEALALEPAARLTTAVAGHAL
jgi:TonB family protein